MPIDSDEKIGLAAKIALLARTPFALDGLLRDLPAVWTKQNEGADTMSAKDVVAHLIDADRTNWVPRMQCILIDGETCNFPAFDRFAYIRASQATPLNDLLDEFSAVRAQRLEDLRAFDLTPQDLDRAGRHPVLGPVTLGHLLSTWTAHDLTHLHQISRILAFQCCNDVGPFARFLGVLKCEGHGA